VRKKSAQFVAILLFAIPLALVSAFCARAFAKAHAIAFDAVAGSFGPWATSQTILPNALAKELGAENKTEKPTVVCVGFRPLYQGAHIPGSLFHGADSTPQGIAGLKAWAHDIPRSTKIVLYCGCCPLEHCPNLKPAFVAMRDMGFTNLRVLILPNDFNTDWIQKGYPVEKGN
jgi:thiosulfate/3-mercaptopyruvate sulfurtransferase